MKLQLTYLSVLAATCVTFAQAQDLAPNALMKGTEISFEGTLRYSDGEIEELEQDEPYTISSSSGILDGRTYTYAKTSGNTATFKILDETDPDEDEGYTSSGEQTILLTFTSKTGGTFSGKLSNSYGQDGGALTTTTSELSGAFSFSGGDFAIASGPYLKDATVEKKYTQQLKAAGGTPPFTWSITSGKLPLGLKLDKKGKITGTPKKAGDKRLIVKVTDKKKQSVSKSVGLEVNKKPKN